MIRSWSGKDAKAIYEGRAPKSVAADVAARAKRKLDMLAAAIAVEDLRIPPSNRLHKIGARWSISVTMQWRVTFMWGDHGPEDVWFGDYH